MEVLSGQSHVPRFLPVEKTGSCVGFRAGLEVLDKRKHVSPARISLLDVMHKLNVKVILLLV
jgi:hypothetical protein